MKKLFAAPPFSVIISLFSNYSMRKRLSQLLVFFLTLVLSAFVFARPAQADIFDWIRSIFSAPEAAQNYQESIQSGNVNNEVHTSEVSTNFTNWLNVQMLGGGVMAEAGGASPEEVSQAEKLYGRGVLGSLQDGIVAMYTPPASGQTYVADLIYNSKLVPQAQAQGLGFASLDPILDTWKIFRNVSYLFFVVIFLVIGFMIMFRSKVGQAAITAQQAIPNILVALLAVTFSYAIAGLMIDLMYLVMYMIAGLMQGGSDMITKNLLGLAGEIMSTNSWSRSQLAVQAMMDDFLGLGVLGDAIAWLSSLAAATIVGIAIIIAVFKIFFELLKTYITVIIQVVFAPIVLMVGAIPGKNTFAGWIKNLAGSLAMWPVVLICLLLNSTLTSSLNGLTDFTVGSAYGGGFMPPFLLGNGQGEIIPVLIGIGILLVIPEIMKQVKKAMGVEDGVFGNLVGAAAKQLRYGELALPYASGGLNSITAGAGGLAHTIANKGSLLRRDGLSADALRETWKNMYEGYETKDRKGRVVQKAGIREGFGKGREWGEGARVTIDRGLSGQLFEAETIEKSLSKMLSKPGDKKPDESGPKPENQVPG